MTLVEGGEVFRDLIRFVVSDAAIVKRVTNGETLSFTEAYVVLPPEEEGAPRLSAIMSPPEGSRCSLVGMNGGVVDLRSVRFDDTQLIRFSPPSNALPAPANDSSGADPIAKLSPRWASAHLAENEPTEEECESVLRAMAEHAVTPSPDQVLAAACVW